jgi:hypothetical protein
MKSTSETITGKVNAAMLEKADRLFRNDDDGSGQSFSRMLGAQARVRSR